MKATAAREPPIRAGRWQLNLGAQLLMGLASLGVIVALVAGATIRHVERSYLHEHTESEKAKTFELLQSALLDDIISADVPRIDTTMRQLITRDEELIGARITDEAGSLLFEWYRQRDTSRAEAASDEQKYAILSFARDVRFMDETFGRLVAEWDFSQAEAEINAHVYIIVLGVGGTCLLLSVLVYLLTNSFAVAPINRISQRVAGFRNGVYGSRTHLPVFAAEELTRLDASVNDLAEFLTHKEAREVELHDAKEAAEAASRAKTEFLANMSHELRTPLNAINGFSEMMGLEVFGPLGNERYREYVQKIHFSGSHLLALINDILDISRVEAGKAVIDKSPVDLPELIMGALGLVEDRCRQSRLELTSHIDDSMPMLLADSRRLQQIFLNLLSNAAKYTPAGGKISLSLVWNAAEGATTIIRDTGIGMAPEQIATAFEPFSRIESAYSRSHDGTGLGLPLAKVMVELHGGSLRLVSEPGVGTEAIVTLPASLAMPAGEAAPQESRPHAASSN